MSKKIIVIFILFLFVLNIVVWQEVFSLNKPHNLVLSFLNVGQGDSAFIQTPQGHQILIDSGPNSLLIEKLSKLMPFWDKDLDLIILTHPEKDHMQGFLSLLGTYKADYILWNGVKRNTLEYEAWVGVIKQQKNSGSKIIIAEAGKDIIAGNVLIDVLHPFKSVEGEDAQKTSNDTCVVLRIIFDKKSFLFTGDIGFKEELNIINSNQNIASNILKVAHHGSKYSTSESFLQEVKPNIALIGVGKSSYGHPTPETLQRLNKFGIQTLRTDADGDIKFVSDGNIIKQIK